MPKLKIETTQNVVFDYEVAGNGDRILAAFLDWIFLYIYGIIAIYIISEAMDGAEVFQAQSGLFLLYNLLLYMPILFYDLVMEYFNDGQSFGKKIMKIKVIKIDGSKPSLGDLLLRWACRLVDMRLFLLLSLIFGAPMTLTGMFYYMPFPVVALIFIGITPYGQRVGDLAADTTVVQAKQRASLEDTILQLVDVRYKPLATNVLRLSDRDINTIKEALSLYERTGEDKHIKTIAKKSVEILEIKKRMPPAKLLRTILKDYNYMATQNMEA